MISRIDPPQMPPPGSTPTHRKTEEVDTKQAILRHEPEFHRNKKRDDDESAFIDAYEDLTDVSVPALHGFLQGLLDKINASRTQTAPGHTHDHADDAPHARAPASPKAAAAMQAYQAGAMRGTHTPPPPPAAPATALDAAALNLDRAELIEVLRDLDRLQAMGVQSISMEKGDGFMASIRAGIARAFAL